MKTWNWPKKNVIPTPKGHNSYRDNYTKIRRYRCVFERLVGWTCKFA